MKDVSLPATIVGIDIETTALDPKAGEIIEVAAIRFDLKKNQEIERFEALCKPKQRLSAEITGITGITQEMVADKSLFQEHISPFQEFIGDDLIFAHNGRFDLSWLAYHGCALHQPWWDTFLLAATAWPEADSYNLGSLAKQLGIEVAGEHRAAADIILTWELLNHIRGSLKVSPGVFKKVSRLLETSGQAHYLPLFSAKDERAIKKETKAISGPEFDITSASIGSILASHGKLESSLQGFRAREAQVALATQLASYFEAKESAIVEAPAGIGKTFAYIVAGLLHGGKFLISTHTRILQDQLVEKDIPALITSLGLRRKVALLKGRANYVCGRRLEDLIAKKNLRPDQAWLALKILVWLEGGGSGDIEHLNISHQSQGALHSLTANTVLCGRNCDNCPYQRARAAAKDADITVVNHALLLRAALGEEGLSADFKLLVVDEAHQLEDAAVSASESGLSGELIEQLLATLVRLVDHEKISAECDALRAEFKLLSAKGEMLLKNHTQDTRLRLSAPVRRSRVFQDFARSIENWLGRLAFLLGLARSQENSINKKEMLLYRETIRRIEKFHLELEEFAGGRSPERVQWVETSIIEGETTLHDAALNIQPYTTGALTLIAPTIAISATLTTSGGFSYIKERFGIEEWKESEFPSAFNFTAQMQCFVIDDGPYPAEASFDQFVAQVIEKIANATRGRLLALFTSQMSLNNVHGMLAKRINREKIRLLSQKISGGRHNIGKRFREEHSSVLLGTHSFWEGFDNPGETLSVLVIPKLPFSQPTDPIIEGLSQLAGNEAFGKVMLPRMTLRLKQGVGRLIRTPSDRGVVVLLDKRLLEKEYGRQVLHSLPASPIEAVSQNEVVGKIEDWFGSETIARWQATP